MSIDNSKKMFTDIQLLLDIIKNQPNNLLTVKKSLLAISNLCCNSDTQSYLYESGGLEFLTKIFIKSDHPEIRNAAMYALGCCIDQNAVCQNTLTKNKIFNIFYSLLEVENRCLKTLQMVTFLVSSIAANNKEGQNLINSSGCLLKFFQLYRTLLDEYSNEKTHSGILQLWSNVTSAINVSMNNPQNDVIQNECSSLFPISLRYIEEYSCHEIVCHAATLICFAVAHNGYNQTRLQKCDGLKILINRLHYCVNRIRSHREHVLTSICLINTLDKAITENEHLANLTGDLGFMELLLQILQITLSSNQKLEVLLTLGHLTELSSANQKRLVDLGGTSQLISLLLSEQSKELSATIKYVLANCNQNTSVPDANSDKFLTGSSLDTTLKRFSKLDKQINDQSMDKLWSGCYKSFDPVETHVDSITSSDTVKKTKVALCSSPINKYQSQANSSINDTSKNYYALLQKEFIKEKETRERLENEVKVAKEKLTFLMNQNRESMGSADEIKLEKCLSRENDTSLNCSSNNDCELIQFQLIQEKEARKRLETEAKKLKQELETQQDQATSLANERRMEELLLWDDNSALKSSLFSHSFSNNHELLQFQLVKEKEARKKLETEAKNSKQELELYLKRDREATALANELTQELIHQHNESLRENLSDKELINFEEKRKSTCKLETSNKPLNNQINLNSSGEMQQQLLCCKQNSKELKTFSRIPLQSFSYKSPVVLNNVFCHNDADSSSSLHLQPRLFGDVKSGKNVKTLHANTKNQYSKSKVENLHPLPEPEHKLCDDKSFKISKFSSLPSNSQRYISYKHSTATNHLCDKDGFVKPMAPSKYCGNHKNSFLSNLKENVLVSPLLNSVKRTLNKFVLYSPVASPYTFLNSSALKTIGNKLFPAFSQISQNTVNSQSKSIDSSSSKLLNFENSMSNEEKGDNRFEQSAHEVKNKDISKNNNCPGCYPPDKLDGNILNSRTYNLAIETNANTCKKHRQIRQQERNCISAFRNEGIIPLGLTSKQYKQPPVYSDVVQSPQKDSTNNDPYEFVTSTPKETRTHQITPPSFGTHQSDVDGSGDKLCKQNESYAVKHNFSSFSRQKRLRIPYSDKETAFLKDGVAQYGHAWTKILHSYPFHPSRRAVDLKDKFRHLFHITRLPTKKNSSKPFSMAEDRRLRRGVRQFGYSWSLILSNFSFELGRKPEELRSRWRTLHKV